MRTVLITGASSGFGRGMVTAFLKDGWQVVAALRRASERRELFAGEPAGRLRIETLDVAEPKDRLRLARSVGTLDCLVNNAGYGLLGPFEDMGEEQFRRQLEVNFFGAALLIKAFLPALRRSRGRVINVSSIFGYAGFPMTAAYCASKFALEGLSEALYYELKPHGIQVALVEPGGNRTRMPENTVWAERCRDAGSAYGLQMRNFLKLKDRLRALPGRDPGKVVKAVVRLAGSRRMPLRTAVGTDAVSVRLLQKVLPESLSVGLFSTAYKRIFES